LEQQQRVGRAAARDTLSGRFTNEGGRRFEEALLDATLLDAATVAAVRRYYEQDMCFLRQWYDWEHVSVPKWHKDSNIDTEEEKKGSGQGFRSGEAAKSHHHERPLSLPQLRRRAKKGAKEKGRSGSGGAETEAEAA
jgi:hypothetical protein